MGDKMTPTELFDRTRAAGARIRKIADEAQEIFWEALAKSLPECRSGDFPPDAAAAFEKACREAAATWFDANKPRRWNWEGREDEFVAVINPMLLPLGWEASWEHPGYLELHWAQGGWKYTITATPDWDSEPDNEGEIVVSVDHSTENVAGQPSGPSGQVHSVVIPWPFKGRTPVSYFEALRPLLDEWSPIKSAAAEFRVEMRPPMKGERGWLVVSRDAVNALAEVLRESENLGWVAEHDYDADDYPDDSGMIPCTVILPGRK